jgi:hypothetical protein
MIAPGIEAPRVAGSQPPAAMVTRPQPAAPSAATATSAAGQQEGKFAVASWLANPVRSGAARQPFPAPPLPGGASPVPAGAASRTVASEAPPATVQAVALAPIVSPPAAGPAGRSKADSAVRPAEHLAPIVRPSQAANRPSTR